MTYAHGSIGNKLVSDQIRRPPCCLAFEAHALTADHRIFRWGGRLFLGIPKPCSTRMLRQLDLDCCSHCSSPLEASLPWLKCVSVIPGHPGTALPPDFPSEFGPDSTSTSSQPFFPHRDSRSHHFSTSCSASSPASWQSNRKTFWFALYFDLPLESPPPVFSGFQCPFVS